MQHYQRSRVQSGRKATRRRDETARKNIVSVRVSDQEKQVLETITRSSSKNVSDIIREAIEFWLRKKGPAVPAGL